MIYAYFMWLWFIWDKEILKGMKIPVEGDVTEKRIAVPDPKNDKYEISAKIKLYNAKDEEMDSTVAPGLVGTIWVASRSYIDKIKG